MERILFLSAVAILYFRGGATASPNRSKSISDLYKKYGPNIAFEYIYQKNKDMPEEKIKAHRRSDVMMLFSIANKKYLQIKRKDRPRKFKLVSASKTEKSYSDKSMLFVTETVSYHKFKIKLAQKDVYLCAKRNGKFSFKDDPENMHGHTRKRCLFNWDLTSQMHVRLFVVTKNGTWHLSAFSDGSVKFLREKQAPEINRSFIWLPTAGKKNKGTSNSHGGERERHFLNTNKESGKNMQCEALVAKCDRYGQKLQQLKERLKYMEHTNTQLNDKLIQKNCRRRKM